ncbi:hypothetical protein [Chitinophaga varians]|uniref:hypothetical protein n=1 Tax=Chitinophaga varians TaxID=2202339 RepID=UPI001CB70A67|nr:hypothetical protein [Chitinophaga varians]
MDITRDVLKIINRSKTGMRLIYPTIILLFGCIGLNAQVKPIYYRFDKEVLAEINKCISKLPLNDTIKPYVQWFNTGDTTEIMLTKYCASCTSSSHTWIVQNSNRFVKIADDRELPIIFGEDLVFTDKLNLVADTGTPKENITTQRYLLSGWVIRFVERNGVMRLVKTYYFQA